MSLDEQLAIPTREIELLLQASQTRSRKIEQLLESTREHVASLRLDVKRVSESARVAEIFQRESHDAGQTENAAKHFSNSLR